MYQGNRASDTVDFEGKQVFAGGENAIAVYSINQQTGEPTLLQNADTHGMSPRTFALDPSASILVAANQVPFLLREGAKHPGPCQPGRLPDCRRWKLTYVRKYDVEATNPHSLFWMGLMPLP